VAKTKEEKINELTSALLAAINAPIPVKPTFKISKSKYMAANHVMYETGIADCSNEGSIRSSCGHSGAVPTPMSSAA